MNMNNNKPEQDLQTQQTESQTPEQAKTPEQKTHKPLRFTRLLPGQKTKEAVVTEMEQPKEQLEKQAVEKATELTTEATVEGGNEANDHTVAPSQEEKPEELKTPFRGLLKKHILTAEELEEKILKTAEQPQKKYQSDNVKKKKKLNLLKSAKNQPVEQEITVEPEKPRLKGAEQFDHSVYFKGNEEAGKTGQKASPKKTSWLSNNHKKKPVPGQEEQKGFFAKHKETINRMGMTAAVLLIVVSAYVGINQAQTGEQDVILPITDTVPVDGENKVEVIDQQTPGTQNGADNQQPPAQQTEAGNGKQGGDGKSAASTTPSVNNDNDYFINYRLERERIRSQQLDLLENMVDDEATLPEVRKEAQEKVLSITKGIEEELLLESLLVAKYGGEAVVFVQPEKVNVVLRKNQDKMSDNEAEKIAQMVDTYTGIGFENAIIVIKE